MATDAHRLVSSSRLPNTRRGACPPPAARGQHSLDKLRRYLDAPVDEEDALVSDESKAHADWLMGIWKKYFEEREIDPDTVWVELCEGSPEAAAWCKTFFSDYVEHSVRSVMVLGPAEYERRQGVNSASTPLAMWRKLVKRADTTVLREKRRREPRTAERWRLRFHGHAARFPTSSIKVFEVSKVRPVPPLNPSLDEARLTLVGQWIWTGLAAEAGLTKELVGDKREATAEDVVLVLRTLWERAAELGIDPKTRVSFHAAVLLSAIGGFRPGCLRQLLYKDVVLSILRDPKDRASMKHATTLTIYRNKMKDSLSPRKDSRVKFSVFFVPSPLVCLGRLILSRALQDDAFDPGFTDAEEFLTRPKLGEVDHIGLKWKADWRDRPVFQLSYRQFNDVWHRVCMAAGFRTLPRLYTMRVGAGARLDENALFSSALRNYVLSHTGAVFEASYQTTHLREDLLDAAFNARTGTDNAPLFAVLRNMSLSRDRNAPINLTEEDRAQFETRGDVRLLRGAIAGARERGELDFCATLTSRLKYVRVSWKRLKLADKRRQYFEEADRSRALGHQPPGDTGHVPNQSAAIRSQKSNAPMADQIVQHFRRKCNPSGDDDDPARYVHLLVEYLKGRSKATLDVWEDDGAADDESDQADLGPDEDEGDGEDDDDGPRGESGELDDHRSSCQKNDGESEGTAGRRGGDVAGDRDFECILCALHYKSRSTLTWHCDKVHKRDPLFDQPFQCPACRQDGKKSATVDAGYPTWLNHLDRFHGQRCTPHFQLTGQSPEKFPCPFPTCSGQGKGKMYNSRGLSGHLARGHPGEQDPCVKGKFKQGVRCRLCLSREAGEGGAPVIDSVWDWRRHIDVDHGRDQREQYQCLLCSDTVRTARGLKSHFYAVHERREGRFAKPFQCPECVRAGRAEAPSIAGREAWQDHVAQHHDGGLRQSEGGGVLDPAQRRPRHTCLFCLKDHSTRDALSHHLSYSHGDVMKKPFQCPECVRQGGADAEPFQNKHAWSLHAAQKHDRTGGPNGEVRFDAASPGLARPVVTPTSGGAKRGAERQSSADPPAQLHCADSPQSSPAAATSVTSSDVVSELGDVPSENTPTSDTSNADPDDLDITRLKRRRKRAKLSHDVEPRTKSACYVQSPAQVDDSVIDPSLRGLRGTAVP